MYVWVTNTFEWSLLIQFTDWLMCRPIREGLPRLHALSLVIALMQSFLKTWFWRASQWLVMEHGMLLTAAHRYVIYFYSLYICIYWSMCATNELNIVANGAAMNGMDQDVHHKHRISKQMKWRWMDQNVKRMRRISWRMDQNAHRWDCSGSIDGIGCIDGIVGRDRLRVSTYVLFYIFIFSPSFQTNVYKYYTFRRLKPSDAS